MGNGKCTNRKKKKMEEKDQLNLKLLHLTVERLRIKLNRIKQDVLKSGNKKMKYFFIEKIKIVTLIILSGWIRLLFTSTKPV